MAYNINLTNGQNLVTIADGETDTSYSSLTLFGKNSAAWGEFLNENLVHLLENFSYVTAPANPLQGQLWWDSSNKRLNVRTETQWKTIGAMTAAAVNPSAATVGEMWWDTANAQLKVYNGSDWLLVGPNYSAGQLLSGPVVTSVVGADGIARTVVLMYVSNVLMGIYSKEPTFTINTIAGFSSIRQGLNISSTGVMNGSATNALSLGGVLAANYLRGDVASVSNNQLSIRSNSGITVGANDNLNLSYDQNSNEARITSMLSSQSLSVRINKAGIETQVLKVNGISGLITVSDDPVEPLGVATKQFVDATAADLVDLLATKTAVATQIDDSETVMRNYVDSSIQAIGSKTVTGLRVSGSILPDVDNVIDIGSESLRFRKLYSTATNAVYADVAENYVADAEYEPGTVLEFGGEFEVTVGQIHSSAIAGVVTTNPAYLMNGMCEGDHVASVALLGRVPCKVRGRIRKGDRLVSAGGGYAESAWAPAPGSIIGKALSDFDGTTGVIEVVVGRG